jgi:hypothetical protein
MMMILTYHSSFIPEGVADILSGIPPRHPHYQIDSAMKNIAAQVSPSPSDRSPPQVLVLLNFLTSFF